MGRYCMKKLTVMMSERQHKKLKLLALVHETTMAQFLREYVDIEFDLIDADYLKSLVAEVENVGEVIRSRERAGLSGS
jgi:hypothetical protein